MVPANERTALLIIDVQEALFSMAEFHPHGPAALLSRIATLLGRARSSGVPVVYVQQCGPPGHALEPGTAGWKVHSAIAPGPGELAIQKKESDAFLHTDLKAELDNLEITTLVVCGMQSEYCVDTTCRRAQGLGYEVLLVEDAHTTDDAGSLSAPQIIEHHNSTLGGTYVTLCAAEDVFA